MYFRVGVFVLFWENYEASPSAAIAASMPSFFPVHFTNYVSLCWITLVLTLPLRGVCGLSV